MRSLTSVQKSKKIFEIINKKVVQISIFLWGRRRGGGKKSKINKQGDVYLALLKSMLSVSFATEGCYTIKGNNNKEIILPRQVTIFFDVNYHLAGKNLRKAEAKDL